MHPTNEGHGIFLSTVVNDVGPRYARTPGRNHSQPNTCDKHATTKFVPSVLGVVLRPALLSRAARRAV